MQLAWPAGSSSACGTRCRVNGGLVEGGNMGRYPCPALLSATDVWLSCLV